MRKYVVLSGLLVAGCVSVADADKTVEMSVGQTKHLTAYRGNGCNAQAPSFAEIQGRLPRSKLVEYSDGGLSSRVSDQCKKRVPTRAVNGTAVAPGQEAHQYQSGSLAIIVR